MHVFDLLLLDRTRVLNLLSELLKDFKQLKRT